MKFMVLTPTPEQKEEARAAGTVATRFFLEDGTELTGISRVDAEFEREVTVVYHRTLEHSARDVPPDKSRMVLRELTLTFRNPEFKRIDKPPERS